MYNSLLRYLRLPGQEEEGERGIEQDSHEVSPDSTGKLVRVWITFHFSVVGDSLLKLFPIVSPLLMSTPLANKLHS